MIDSELIGGGRRGIQASASRSEGSKVNEENADVVRLGSLPGYFPHGRESFFRRPSLAHVCR